MLDACSFCGVLGGQLPQRVTRSVPDVRLCWKLATGRFVTPTARRVACSLATLVSLDDDRLHLDADFIEDALPQDRAFARGKGLQSDQRSLRRRHGLWQSAEAASAPTDANSRVAPSLNSSSPA